MTEASSSFNLVTDPWIPVVTPQGTRRLASLQTLYEDAGRIRDLACNPPQRITVMRLLICITQAALEGPEDEEDWLGCRDRIAARSLNYLARWRDAFDLYGDRPFMQVASLEVEPTGWKPLDILDLRLARENNPTVFDHGATREGRAFADSKIALNLLTILNFSTSGKVGQAIWGANQYGHSTSAAPCLDCAMTFVRAANLLDTIHLNLMTKNGDITGVLRLPNGVWGVPAWERFPTAPGTTDPGNAEAFRNARESYLGRLVPFSRLIKVFPLDDPPRCILGPTPQHCRMEGLPRFRDPWCAIVQGSAELKRMVVDPSRHMWRELGSLLSLRMSRAGLCGPLPIHNLLTFFRVVRDDHLDIWVGGVKSGGGGGKIEDMAEWAFRIQPAHLHETAMARLEAGTELADRGAKALHAAVKKYHGFMNTELVPYDRAGARFWAELDRQHAALLGVAADPCGRLAETWYPIVRRAMQNAYAYVCPRGTAREIEAFALGRERLRLRRPEE